MFVTSCPNHHACLSLLLRPSVCPSPSVHLCLSSFFMPSVPKRKQPKMLCLNSRVLQPRRHGVPPAMPCCCQKAVAQGCTTEAPEEWEKFRQETDESEHAQKAHSTKKIICRLPVRRKGGGAHAGHGQGGNEEEEEFGQHMDSEGLSRHWNGLYTEQEERSRQV